MQTRMTGQRRDPLVQLRVVLHRARAERIEALVDVEVAGRQGRVVADDLGFGNLWKLGRIGAAEALGERVVVAGNVELGRDERAPTLDGLVEDRSGHARLPTASPVWVTREPPRAQPS